MRQRGLRNAPETRQSYRHGRENRRAQKPYHCACCTATKSASNCVRPMSMPFQAAASCWYSFHRANAVNATRTTIIVSLAAPALPNGACSQSARRYCFLFQYKYLCAAHGPPTGNRNKDEILDRFSGKPLKLAISCAASVLLGASTETALGTLNKLRHGEGLAAAGYAGIRVALLIINAFNGSSMALGWSPAGSDSRPFKGAPALGLFRPVTDAE